MHKKSTIALAKHNAKKPKRLKFFLIIIVLAGFGILFLSQEYKRVIEKFTAPSLSSEQDYKPYDLDSIREKKVINPRYIGVDGQKRPYVITAKSGEHGENEVVKLDHVDAAMQLKDGESFDISAAHGEIENLDKNSKIQLSGGVTIAHNGGYEAETKAADVDLATNTVNSGHPTNGSSPYGDWKSEGFALDHNKKTLSLKGKSRVVFNEGEAK